MHVFDCNPPNCIDVIIPWTERSKYCRRSLEYVVKRLQQQPGVGRVIVVESDKKPTGYPAELTEDYYALRGEANLGWAGNYGFRQSTTDIVALINSSMLLPLETFIHALNSYKEGFEGGKLSAGFSDLKEEQSKIVYGMPHASPLEEYPPILCQVRGGCRFGGAFWLTRELWEDLHGMNELYFPSGLEDMDMNLRFNAMDPGRKWSNSIEKTARHLYHSEGMFTSLWQDRVIEFISQYTREQMRKYTSKLPTNFGDPEGPHYYWPEGMPGERPKAMQMEEIKLDIGCGGRGSRHRGFTGIDLWPRPKFKTEVDYVRMNFINDDLPWKPNSVDMAIALHIIEHLHLEDGKKLIARAVELLKVDAELIISCPDLKLFAEKYLEGDKDFYNNTYRNGALIWPGDTLADRLNWMIHQQGHKWAYDQESLFHHVKAVVGNTADVWRLPKDHEWCLRPGHEIGVKIKKLIATPMENVA